MTTDQTARIAELLKLIEAAIRYGFTGSAEHGSFLRGSRTEWVPSVFMTLEELRDLLTVQQAECATLRAKGWPNRFLAEQARSEAAEAALSTLQTKARELIATWQQFIDEEDNDQWGRERVNARTDCLNMLAVLIPATEGETSG